MPFIVTDAAVLAQIATDDGLAAGVDAEFADLTNVPRATLDGWKARYAAYQAWAKVAREALSGGFFGGAWFGVPQFGNQAVAWADELGYGEGGKVGWQSIVNDLAAGRTPRSVVADAVSQQDVADKNAAIPPGVSLDGSTKLLIAAGIGLVALSILAEHLPHLPRGRR